jgi:hypothetical protein
MEIKDNTSTLRSLEEGSAPPVLHIQEPSKYEKVKTSPTQPWHVSKAQYFFFFFLLICVSKFIYVCIYCTGHWVFGNLVFFFNFSYFQ